MKGGYQVLDLKSTRFTSGVPKTVKGIYDRCNSKGKPILVAGPIVVDNIFIPCGVFTCLTLDVDGSFFGTLATQYMEDGYNIATTITIRVTAYNTVTLTATVANS